MTRCRSPSTHCLKKKKVEQISQIKNKGDIQWTSLNTSNKAGLVIVSRKEMILRVLGNNGKKMQTHVLASLANLSSLSSRKNISGDER